LDARQALRFARIGSPRTVQAEKTASSVTLLAVEIRAWRAVALYWL